MSQPESDRGAYEEARRALEDQERVVLTFVD